MTSITTAATTIQLPDPDYTVDAAELAAAAFLARYRGRTLDAYRHDCAVTSAGLRRSA